MREVEIRQIISFLEDKKISFAVRGKYEKKICGFAPINCCKEGCITWIKSSSVQCNSLQHISLCIAPYGIDIEADMIIMVKEPKMVFFEILNEFFYEEREAGISANTIIETQKIGKNVTIGHYCYIGKDVVIGDNVVIKNHVQIECPTVIGDDCVISSGVVIGTDGFGYYQDVEGIYKRVPHFGGVRIGNSVDIGANTCIDRGTMGDTCIDDNVKIDNLCHIAHNVHIGENSLVIALSMLGGSAELGKGTYIAPGCLVKNQIMVDEDSFVGMGAVVLENVRKGKIVVGVPARELRDR